MKNTLKDGNGKFYGRIGASACFNYSDRTGAKVGDLVGLYYDGKFECECYVVQKETGDPFVMGIGGTYIKNGVGEGDDYIWTIKKIKDSSSITDGMKDSQGIIANIAPEETKFFTKQETDLLYCFVAKGNIPFESRKHIEQMIDCGIIQVCAHHFVSAKIINKRTGVVIDLLS